MWAIIKINKKKINLLRQDFSKYFDTNYKIYSPKIKIKNFKKNNLKFFKEVSILGDYIFCFHSSLSVPNKLDYIKKFRGLKLFVNGHIHSQDEIINFIKRCKENEDQNGFLLQEFFETEINKSYEFVTGPFAKKIFSIIGLQKNKLQTTIGNIKTTINRKDFLYRPI
jgi:hypothetical protein